MARRSTLAPVGLLLATLAGSAPALARARPHMWTDSDGVLHVDDSPPAAVHRSPRRATPRTAEAAPQHWWEKRSDAPPDTIDQAATLYKVPAELVRAVIAVESAGDASAVSHKGALGLMQLMPRTAGEMYVQDPVDPAQNILGGTRYLRYLANMFEGDMLLTLAAYNAGPDAVRRYGGVPPFDETRQYVRKVMALYFELKRHARTKVASLDRQPAAAAEGPAAVPERTK